MTPSEQFKLKLPVPSGMSSSEWEQIASQIRDQAFYAARVEEKRIIDQLQEKLTQIIRNDLDPSEYRRDMREFLAQIGYSVDDDDVGTIKDLRTQRRLDIIYQTNVKMARGFKQWRQFTTDAALKEYPACRLVRVQGRKMPRDWSIRWKAASEAVGWQGVYRGGDMVALKSSPVWFKISRFGHNYPPFDYNSGMGVENVSIDECLKIGLVKPDDPPQKMPEVKLFTGQQTE